jgi:hypothetical protein
MTAPPPGTGSNAVAGRYYRARAALETGPVTETYTEAAAAAVELWRAQPGVAWVAGEVTWLSNVLLRAGTHDFNRDTNPVPAIDLLSGVTALPLGDRISLLAIGGAYLVGGSTARGREMKPEHEERFVCGPVRTYRRRSAELTDAERARTGTVLAACLGGALVARTKLGERLLTRCATLVQAAAIDRAELRGNLTRLRHQSAVLQQFLALAEGLPVDPGLCDQVRARLPRWDLVIDRIRPLV